MLGRVISRVVAAGADRIVVNVHHFPDMVADYLRRTDFGVDVLVSDERDCLLDTGGGLLKAMPLFDNDEPILLHNARYSHRQSAWRADRGTQGFRC